MIRRRVIENRVSANPFVRHFERIGHLAVNHRADRCRRDLRGLGSCGRVVGREREGCSRERRRDVVLPERAEVHQGSKRVQQARRQVAAEQRPHKSRVNLKDSASAAAGKSRLGQGRVAVRFHVSRGTDRRTACPSPLPRWPFGTRRSEHVLVSVDVTKKIPRQAAHKVDEAARLAHCFGSDHGKVAFRHDVRDR